MMLLKPYLIDTFRFNEATNLALLPNIAQLPEPAEAIRLFSHLINSQYKWMARIRQDPKAVSMDWWEPAYPFAQLESAWKDSLQEWYAYLDAHDAETLTREVEFHRLRRRTLGGFAAGHHAAAELPCDSSPRADSSHPA